MNEWTHFFIKIYLSHFFLKRVDVSVVRERWVERHILREWTSSHIFYREPGGANACTPLQAHQRQPDRLRVPRSTAIPCTLSKSDRVVLIIWSLSSYTPVWPACPDALSSSCLLIKMWQFAKAHRVTRNKSKMHGICYLTYGHLSLISLVIQVRQTRHVGYCWRNKNKLISNILFYAWVC